MMMTAKSLVNQIWCIAKKTLEPSVIAKMRFSGDFTVFKFVLLGGVRRVAAPRDVPARRVPKGEEGGRPI